MNTTTTICGIRATHIIGYQHDDKEPVFFYNASAIDDYAFLATHEETDYFSENLQDVFGLSSEASVSMSMIRKVRDDIVLDNFKCAALQVYFPEMSGQDIDYITQNLAIFNVEQEQHTINPYRPVAIRADELKIRKL